MYMSNYSSLHSKVCIHELHVALQCKLIYISSHVTFNKSIFDRITSPLTVKSLIA